MSEGWIVKNMRTGSLSSQPFDSHIAARLTALKLNSAYQTNEYRVVNYQGVTDD
jgi:hypothetical protein